LGIEPVGVTSVRTWLVRVVEWGTVARVNLADEAVAVVGMRERAAWRQKVCMAGAGRAANQRRAWLLVGARLEAGFPAGDDVIR
jgi:hypothetical protein